MTKDINGTELKVGDKVRRVEKGTDVYPLGTEGIIRAFTFDGDAIYLEGSSWNAKASNWEKIEEQNYRNPPHPHAEVIKAWADGAEVEWRMNKEEDWKTIPSPMFNKYYQYRVKPQESEALRAAKEQLHQAEKAVQAASEAVQRLQES